MPSLPRSQHYVPEFHLAQFIGLPYRRFDVFDKKWGKFGRRPVAKSAFSRDYYLLPGDTDEERLRLEWQFALLEDQAAPLIKWLAIQPPGPLQLADQDRDTLVGYAAILHIRSRSNHERLDALPRWVAFCNQRRPHTALDGQVPLDVLVNNVRGNHT